MTEGYEAGMKITFEARSRLVMVRFRGRLVLLPGRYGREDEAVDAGEAFCRQQGWRPGPARPIPAQPAPAACFRSAW